MSKPRVPFNQSGIVEIARVAKVSPMTVSRAFSGSAPVAAKTRARIMSVAEELGYRPNLHARALRGGRTQSIGLLISMNSTPSILKVLRNITISARKEEYVIYISDHLGDVASEEQSLIEYLERHVDGVIFQGSERLLSKKVLSLLAEFPAVTVITSEPADLPFSHVVQDRTAAIREVVDHFYASGRRRIRYLANVEFNERKVAAFLQQLESHGLSDGEKSILNMNSVSDSDCSAFVEALNSHFPDGRPDMDALHCSCDEAAIIAMSWLNSRGIRVPDDIAVVGFNNITIAEYQTVPLASVDRREDEMIDVVLQMLYSRFKDPGIPASRVELPMKFIWRESAGS
jgi:DNA-binding LacI/PurR family transcriptional regulator